MSCYLETKESLSHHSQILYFPLTFNKEEKGGGERRQLSIDVQGLATSEIKTTNSTKYSEKYGNIGILTHDADFLLFLM